MLKQHIHQLNENSPLPDFLNPYVLGGVCFAIILTTVLIYSIRHRHRSPKIQIDRLLAPYQKEALRQVIIPDGLGSRIEIEHLVLLPQGVLVLQTYQINGQLFGAENIHQWTQMIGGRSFKFNNPLNHLRNIQESLKMIVPKMPIYTAAIFTEEAHFPKGKPSNVTNLKSMQYDLMPLLTLAPIVDQPIQAMWQTVVQVVENEVDVIAQEAA